MMSEIHKQTVVFSNKMNWAILMIGVMLVSFVTAQKYTDRYDSINIDEILANKRLLAPYIKCMLEQGRCTPEGKELKNNVRDAIQSSCEKCTEFQRKSARKVVKHLKEKEPEFWEQLKSKYDPGDKFKESYEAFLARDD